MLNRSLNFLTFVWSLGLLILVFFKLDETAPFIVILGTIVVIITALNFVWGLIYDKKIYKKIDAYLHENGFNYEEEVAYSKRLPTIKNSRGELDWHYVFGVGDKLRSFQKSVGKEITIGNECTIYAMEFHCIVDDRKEKSLYLYKKF